MFRIGLLIFLLAAWAATVSAEPLRIAVASNFLVPAKALAERFAESSGKAITVSVGSTGKLYAQIVNGAPYSIFLAANVSEPERLEADGRAVAGSRFTYATGRLVLWSRSRELSTGDHGAGLIRRQEFTRLAIANPRTAPYGAAAVQAMQALGLDPMGLGAHLVRGENVSQAYQFIASGNVDAGFVALSQMGNSQRSVEGNYWLVPADLHDPIEQQAVLLERAAADAHAKAFLHYLRSPGARALIAGYGYGAG